MQNVPIWKVILTVVVLFALFYPLMSWKADARFAVPDILPSVSPAPANLDIVSEQVAPPTPPQENIEAPVPKEAISMSEPVFPVEGVTEKAIISWYGDPRSGGKRLHEGVDIKAERGTPVLAIQDGVVHRVKEGGSGGKQVWLRSDDGLQFFYAHLDDWLVEEGQIVDAGDPLGTVGNTGNAQHTIPHLHFGIYVDRRQTTDPLPYLENGEVLP